jgi:glycosyltransferase involved in cell wall biosynthesis
MRLSVAIPVLNEEANISALHEAIVRELSSIEGDVEILFVDDGSTDETAARIVEENRRDPRVKLLCLSRTFGHQVALTAGMDHATGDAVIVMDGDLQHPPSLLPQLVAKWREGYDIVYTVRVTTERAGLLKRWSSALFYRLFRRLSGVDLPANAADFRLLDRKVVDAFRRIRERTRFLRGLTQWAGYRTTAIPFRADPRHGGESKYTWKRMLRFAAHGVISFSVKPLYAAIWVGLALALLGFLYLVYAAYSRFVSGNVVPGWTSLIMLFAIVGGIQLFLMGVIGVYVGTIYEEVKQRPLYLVKSALGVDEAMPPGRPPDP